MDMTFETKINVIQGVLSIVTFVGGVGFYFKNRSDAKKARWVEQFRYARGFEPAQHVRLIRKAMNELRSQDSVREAYVQGCDPSGLSSEALERNFTHHWNTMITEDISMAEQAKNG